MLALDARVTGEDRALALDASGAVATPDLAASRSAAVARTPDPRARSGRRRDAAAAVIEPGPRLAVPEANVAAVAALLALGAEERAPVTRMRRGPAVAWRPEELWGVFSLFFG